LAFLAAPMTSSSSSPDTPRSGGCHLPRCMQRKPGSGQDSVPPRECREPGHQDHADEKTVGRETSSRMDPAIRGCCSEDDDAEDSPGHGLHRGDVRHEVCSGATLKALCMSHSPTRVTAIKRVSASWSAPGTRR
jgi:hypothetical protein